MLNMMNLLNEIIKYERSKDEELDARCRQNEERAAMETAIKLKVIESEYEEAITYFDSLDEAEEHDILVDTVSYEEKPQGKQIAEITNRLPHNSQSLSIEQIANLAVSGHSWKASVLSGTSNDSFVSTSLVALDIDNKNSYTSIDEFLSIDSIYKPCLIYTTFSSTDSHERFRAVYAFDKAILTYSEAENLYKEVRAQYEGVDIDLSVGPGKILFGGKEIKLLNDHINKTPDSIMLSELFTVPLPSSKKSQLNTKVSYENKHMTYEELLQRVSCLELDISNVEELNIYNDFDWINKNVPMNKLLDVELNETFKCVIHNDHNPSAWITQGKGYQLYMCHSCGKNITLIDLLGKMFPNMSKHQISIDIIESLGLEIFNKYQRDAIISFTLLRRNLNKMVPADSVLGKYMKLRNLNGIYDELISIAQSNISQFPMTKDKSVVTFYASEEIIAEQMEYHQRTGYNTVDKKMQALKELGILRAIPDTEIKKSVLDNFNTNKTVSVGNRVSLYEIVPLSENVIAQAEEHIQTRKELGYKAEGCNMTRRYNAFGKDKTQEINVQANINNISENADKTYDKIKSSAEKALQISDYVSEKDIRKQYDPQRRLGAKKIDKLVCDYIPALIRDGVIKRTRVNKNSRTLYSIPEKVKSGSFVYVAA